MQSPLLTKATGDVINKRKMSTLSFITAHQQQHYIGPSSSVVVHHLNTARRCGDTLLHNNRYNKRQTTSLCKPLVLNLSLRPDENTNALRQPLQLCLSLRPDENTNDVISNQLLPPKALRWSIAASAAAAISYADRGALGWLLY